MLNLLLLFIRTLIDIMGVLSTAPHVPDPFQTLADIYEAKGDTDKRMQVCFLVTVDFSYLILFLPV